jgi:outer membrane protein OmpA-like peptidoglycan-associated protein
VTNFLERYPDYHIKILGSSDPRGDVAANYRLALRRAQSVERELIKRGIAKQRIKLIPMVLDASANNNSSPPQGEPVPEWKLRRVEFLVVPPPN